MTDVEEVADLFQRHRDELGFVNRAQVREKTVLTETVDGAVVAALLANHCVQKPQTTLYDVAVDAAYRRQGLATKLVEQLYDESPHNCVVAKCPVDLSATAFYESTGWKHVRTESGKNTPLAVYMYEK